ncbi:PfkB family carbohydrate kinase [Singulisphaera sp. PoT]|uniref:PfkB family carbohydrate kinase n=1 Tax=Singulisphaera sp. PoT TaxID=3411797 RepID=UPI003BF61B15
MAPRILVFGPAYLDRVLHVDRPLVDPQSSPPLDQSVDGAWKFGDGLTLVDPNGSEILVSLPNDWPGPNGTIEISGPLGKGLRPHQLPVEGLSWHDDLGGMGAGYAAAFGGELISALGSDNDSMSRSIAAEVASLGIVHHPSRLDEQPADWTLLVTSGRFGDKLPIGFRGCHARWSLPERWLNEPCDLRVVAALPNTLASQTLRAKGAAIRFFAPTMRNMTDPICQVAEFADEIDILSCNRHEWERLPNREQIAWRVSILSITDGENGAEVRFTSPTGEPGHVHVPVFPRELPPRDTNRAGEAFASTLVRTLLDHGWRSGVIEESLIRNAAERAAAAAALELDMLRFGFPSPTEVDSALASGRIPAPDRPEDETADLR